MNLKIQASVPEAVKDPPRTKLLNTEEASALLGGKISSETLRYWRHVGKGPRWAKLGGTRVVYRESDVLAFIEEQFAASDGGTA